MKVRLHYLGFVVGRSEVLHVFALVGVVEGKSDQIYSSEGLGLFEFFWVDLGAEAPFLTPRAGHYQVGCDAGAITLNGRPWITPRMPIVEHNTVRFRIYEATGNEVFDGVGREHAVIQAARF